jgi:hypothetical protein
MRCPTLSCPALIAEAKALPPFESNAEAPVVPERMAVLFRMMMSFASCTIEWMLPASATPVVSVTVMVAVGAL